MNKVMQQINWGTLVSEFLRANPSGIVSDFENIFAFMSGLVNSTDSWCYLPVRGSLNFSTVRVASIPGQLDFFSGKNSVYRLIPKKVELKLHSRNIEESVFFLHCAEQELTGMARSTKRDTGLIVEAERGFYPIDVWSHGVIGHDHLGDDVILPNSAILVNIILRGKLKFAYKYADLVQEG